MTTTYNAMQHLCVGDVLAMFWLPYSDSVATDLWSMQSSACIYLHSSLCVFLSYLVSQSC